MKPAAFDPQETFVPGQRMVGPARKRSFVPDCRPCLRQDHVSSSSSVFVVQVGGVEPLGEPAVDRGEEVVSFGAAALLAPQSGEIAGGAQFQRFRLLGLRDAARLLKRGLALVEPVPAQLAVPLLSILTRRNRGSVPVDGEITLDGLEFEAFERHSGGQCSFA
jgi:hypothetical protein